MYKENNKNGFTLAELLIVVAIISVLTAVSIPVFTGQLEKAKQSVDISNMRSAQAAAMAEYLSGDDYGSVLYNYDASTGMVTSEVPLGYGKSKSLEYNGKSYEPLDKYVQVSINGSVVDTYWCGDTSPIVSGGSTPTIDPIDIPDTPEPNPGSGHDVEPVDVDYSYSSREYVVHNVETVSDYPTGAGGSVHLSQGDVFVYLGNTYVVHAENVNHDFNGWYNTPDQLNESVKVSSNPIRKMSDLIVKNNTTVFENVRNGDIYVDDDGKMYILAWGDNIDIQPYPNDGRWVPIG